jgi:phytoene desaturase
MNSKAIVIGTGFGGLGSAVRLRAMGYEVQVVEAGPTAGGRARVFEREGHIFDAGPTVITAPYLIEELFTALGKDMRDYLELLPVDPFYRVLFPDGTQFDYVGDEERILDQIRQINPKDVDGYIRFAAHAKRIFEIGYEGLADQPFDRVSEMMRAVPDMIKLESYRSVYNLCSKYIKDENLRQVFTFQPLLVGGNPFNTSSIYMLIHWLERKWGVFFAKGGTGSIVRALVKVLEESGVQFAFNSSVEEILIENGTAVGVRTATGETYTADIVVSNADTSTTYTKMIDPKWRKKHTDRAVDRKRFSMSLFVSYFGTEKQFPDLAHHMIVLGPRYKGLLNDVFNKKILAPDFSLYLHAPGRSDPSMAPEGKDSFYVLSPVPNQRSGIDWEQEHDRYHEAILDHLDQRVMPGLKANLGPNFAVDPRYFQQDLQSYQGAAFGIEPVLHQSAYFRYHNKSDDIPGLYLVGASTHPGAGVPGVLCSAKVLERVVPRPEYALPLESQAKTAK